MVRRMARHRLIILIPFSQTNRGSVPARVNFQKNTLILSDTTDPMDIFLSEICYIIGVPESHSRWK
jgi:hypothetical protein